MEGNPVFVPDPHLDEQIRFLYDLEPSPRVQVHATMTEKIQLLELLEKSGRLSFRAPRDVYEGYGNGMFCVAKNT